MKKFMLRAAAISAAISLGVATWLLIAPANHSNSQWIRITPGAKLEAVADSLEMRQLLRARWAFVSLGKVTGWGNQIKAGCYRFDAGASTVAVLRRLRSGEQTPVNVSIPAGSRPEFVARRAARHMFFSENDFADALVDSALAETLGTDTRHLFSYMLPDTYHFYCTSDASVVISRIKRTVDALFADGLAARAATHDLDKDEVISLAGIVEWETRVDEEKARVAGVYLNRLQKKWPLQADPTIQYALIEIEGGKRRLLFSDYKLRHPYNTYLYRGFPPGPITNPGRTSLAAAANPEQHNYMFFVAKPEGGHAFNVTLRDHNRDAARLRRYLRQRRARATD